MEAGPGARGASVPVAKLTVREDCPAYSGVKDLCMGAWFNYSVIIISNLN